MASIIGGDVNLEYSLDGTIREFEYYGEDKTYDISLLAEWLYGYVQRHHRTTIYVNFAGKSEEEIKSLLPQYLQVE